MNISFKENFLKHKKIIILVGLIILIIGLILFWVYISAETSSDCIGTSANTQHCCTCLAIDASPNLINQGDSSTLTLYVDNSPDVASSVCSPNGFSAGDGTAVCSIDNGVRSNTTFNDGSYGYSVSPSNTITYTATCSGIGGVKTASVTITVILNQSPIATNLTVDSSNYCTYSLPTIFSWDFSDPDIGDVQEYYQVQADNNALFSSPEVDSGKIHSSSGAYTGSGFSYNTTYYWRLKVWDDKGADSGWISGPSFSTPTHKYPDTDFTWSPSSPSIDEIVQLCAVQTGVCATNQSTCYNASNNPISCSGKTFLWTLPPEAEFATTSTASTENPEIKFTDSGNYTVILRITDDVGSCPQSHEIQATLPLPEWEETTP